MWIFLIVVGALIVFGLVYAIGIYNGLVTFRNRYKNAFSQIDIQLKRRHDLIPNLVETAKAYLTHERETLEAVMKGRSQAVTAVQQATANSADRPSIENLTKAEGFLSQSLGRLLAVVESYPDLKADKTMSQLTEELSSTENRISFARQAYNDSVMEYNTAIEVFPNSIFAGAFAFRAAGMFELTSSQEREVPKVKFA